MKLLSRESIASNNQRDASINNQESYEDVPTFNSDNEVKKNTGQKQTKKHKTMTNAELMKLELRVEQES